MSLILEEGVLAAITVPGCVVGWGTMQKAPRVNCAVEGFEKHKRYLRLSEESRALDSLIRTEKIDEEIKNADVTMIGEPFGVAGKSVEMPQLDICQEDVHLSDHHRERP